MTKDTQTENRQGSNGGFKIITKGYQPSSDANVQVSPPEGGSGETQIQNSSKSQHGVQRKK